MTLNFNWGAINHDSVVLVTASEYAVTTPASDEHRFIGAASITVENIAPPSGSTGAISSPAA
ncbi:hypothetical protein [Kutzneria sp. CA-103260]|uniref:hypothetical protein n=1 Tax=Kutzneria sp. CA-103260 TaxID=2802641 RepID=UPI001BA67492|nr:hypothetical protein [Kutzneria sp. CA-103260]